MAVYNSKDKLAYFKDNKQTQDNSDDFDITKYYYNREGITSNTPPIPSSSSSSSSSSSLSSNSLLSSSNSLNEQQLLQQQQQLSHNANLTHQQRIPMTQMAGRSQSGGNPGMQISGDSHYTGVPQISRSATTPYASGPSMNMYHQMPNRISEINGNGPAQQMPYNLPRSAHDGNIQYDNNNFPGLPSQLRYPLNSMGQQSQQHSQQQTQTLQHHHQQQQQQHQQHSSIGNIQQNRSDEEFTIHNEEDFPALPGSSQHKLGGNRNDHSTEDNNNNNNNNNSTTATNNNNNSNNNNNNQYDQLPNGNAFGSNMSNIRQVSNQQQFAQQPSSNTISGNNSFVGSNQPNHPPSPGLYSSSSNVPPNRLLLPRTVTSPKLQPVSSDGNSTKPEAKFGLLGLIDVIRLTDRDLNILALGSDLTAIGLNLNSADCLYASFSSPFADHTISTEPNFSTPSCYLMHPPNLKAEHLNKFLPETLFYMFYAMPRDGFQMTAAQELYRREWKYHGELKIWLKSRSPQELMQSHPSIQYIYFDPSSWEIRLFSGPSRIPIATGFLSDEEIRGKIQQIAGNAPNPSVTIPGMTGT